MGSDAAVGKLRRVREKVRRVREHGIQSRMKANGPGTVELCVFCTLLEVDATFFEVCAITCGACSGLARSW